MKVKASNGLVFDLPESVASGLISSDANDFVACDDDAGAPETGRIQPAESGPTSPEAPPVKRRPGRPRKDERAHDDSSASRYGV